MLCNRDPRVGWKYLLYSTAIAAAFIVIGYTLLDIRIAAFISKIAGSDFLQSETVSNMPDILFVLVWFVTVAGWSGYFYTARKSVEGINPDFFKLIGSSVPLVYILKAILKQLVGRTNTRTWLVNPDLYGLHWFHGGGEFSSFPSGHMAVFTALLLGVSRYFPRLRRPCLGFLIVLAMALIATEYHYFSDVVAGAYLGLLVDFLICRAYFAEQKIK